MKFHLNHLGQDLGIHDAEELRRRRDAGELTGSELVWRPGMTQWDRLDAVLPPPAPADAVPPTPAPAAAAIPPRPSQGPRTSTPAFWITVAFGVMAGFLGIVVLIAGVLASQKKAGSLGKGTGASTVSVEDDIPTEIPSPAESAPLRIPATSRTAAKRTEMNGTFLRHHYLEAFRRVADPRLPTFAEDVAFLEGWISSQTKSMSPEEWRPIRDAAMRHSTNTAPQDPVVLLATALTTRDDAEGLGLLERAEKALAGTPYGPYPRFRVAAERFQRSRKEDPNRAALAEEAVRRFGELFSADGLRVEDEEHFADTFLVSWGTALFRERGADIVEAARKAGPEHAWLAWVLEGEWEIDLAWKARGSGTAGTVSAQAFRDFDRHLAVAEKALSQAWERHPAFPRPAARMITVSMGRQGAQEMRQWFDRAVEAEMNYAPAWNALFYGLRPRWHGDRDALLAVGRAALETGRFDTGVPRRAFDAVLEVEEDLTLAPGRRIFGDPDVWPMLETMYRGYISNSTETSAGWRTAFAVVAHIAGRHDVAREQLDTLSWNPDTGILDDWKLRPVPFMNAIRIRTGPAGPAIVRAERARSRLHASEASKALEEGLRGVALDDDARPLVEDLRRLLAVETRLEGRDWVPFLPTSTNDPLWRLGGGTVEKADTNAFEIRIKDGSHTAYSRLRVGSDFEIRGEFEVVSTSNGDFQAGFVFGHPESSGRGWQSVRFKQSREEGAVATIAQAWSRTQVLRPAPVLAKGANRFRFRLKGCRATVELNGKRVFDNDAFPDGPRISTDDYEVGIGAYNRDFETVVRYRNVEIRRL